MGHRVAPFCQFSGVPGIRRGFFAIMVVIPGSLVLRAARNDVGKPPVRRLWCQPFELRQLMPEPGELPLGVMAGGRAAAFPRPPPPDSPPLPPPHPPPPPPPPPRPT